MQCQDCNGLLFQFSCTIQPEYLIDCNTGIDKLPHNYRISGKIDSSHSIGSSIQHVHFHRLFVWIDQPELTDAMPRIGWQLDSTVQPPG